MDETYAGKTDRELLVEIHTRLSLLTEECCVRGNDFERVKAKVNKHDTYFKIVGGGLVLLIGGVFGLLSKYF